MADTTAPHKLKLPQRNSDLVLVAGAAGFVGSWLSEAICNLGTSIIGLDSLKHGDTQNKERNLERLKTLDDFEFIETDVAAEFPATLRRKKITHIVDASDTFPQIGSAEQRFDELINTSHGLKNLLDLANHHGVRLLYTSSAFVYQGLASHESLKNYYDGPELSSFYTYLEVKRYGEVLCHEYVERYGLDARIARLPEIYGPRMDLTDNSTLARLIRLAVDGKDLVVDEEGSRKHALLYIDDAVYGLIKLLFANDERTKASIFYFTNPEAVSTLSISYTLRELLDPNRKVDFEPTHKKITLPDLEEIDISRSERILKWDPQIHLTTGLKRTLDWLKQSPRHPAPARDAANEPEPADENSTTELSSTIEPSSTTIQPDPDLPDPEQKKIRGWLSRQKISAEAQPQTAIEGLARKIWWRPHPTEAFLSLVLIGLIFLLPLLISAGLSVRAVWAARGLEFGRAARFSQQSLTFYEFYKAPAFIVGLGNQYLSLEHTLQAAIHGSRALANGAAAAAQLTPIWTDISQSWHQQISTPAEPSDSFNPDEHTGLSTPAGLLRTIDQARVYIPNLKTDYALLQNSVNQINESALAPPLRASARKLKDYTRLLAPLATNLDTLLDQTPLLLGYSKPQRYLIWLQNNTEIRATGGFIGSYAAVTLDQGRVTEFKVDDIYNPDGLLEEHADPTVPEPVQKYMQVKYLGLRDSNWWPKFPESAGVFVKLYQDATNEDVDGVVAINLNLVQKLLAFTGPVQLTAYNEKITAENVFERAQFHSEVGFEPGSTQKRDFLAHLANALLVEILTDPEKLGLGLGQLVGQGLTARDIMVYSTHSDLQKVLADSALTGHVNYQAPAPVGAGQAIQPSDHLFIVDSNVGGNKANFWVNRISKYTLDVDRDGRLSGILTVTWIHTGTNATWPNGDYQNYVRIYLPGDVTDIQVDPPLTDGRIVDESGYKSVQGLAEVPIDTIKKLTVSYRLPDRLALTSQNPYLLTWENQPGLDEEIEFLFNLPGFLSSSNQTHQTFSLHHPTRFQISVTGTEAFE